MRRIFLFCLVAAALVACNTKPAYIVEGTIEGADQELFQLMQVVDDELVVIDSAMSSKGSFKMKGSVDYPKETYLVVAGSNTRMFFFLENAEIEVIGKIDSLSFAKVNGSKTHDEYLSYASLSDSITAEYDAIEGRYQLAYQTDDTAAVADYERQLASIEERYDELPSTFLKTHTSSFFAPELINSILYRLSVEEIEEMLNSLSPEVSQTPKVDEIRAVLETMKSVAIGKEAPDFTLNDVDGKPVSLRSVVGSKLLLIDFWASWCGPCRRENPNVVKTYKEFQKRGFNIVGVSLDESKEAWMKAIDDDKLSWTHLSDLQGWQSSAAALYAVRSIPSNFLLDENGVIIARDLRGDELYDTVKNIVGN